MRTAPDIIFFSGIEWFGQNRMPCHHLVERLSKRHRVFYINNFGALRQLDRHDIRRSIDKILGIFKGRKNPHQHGKSKSSVKVWQPWVIPIPSAGLIGLINRWLLRRSLRKLYLEHQIENPIVWTRLPTDIVWDVIDGLEKSLFIYQSIDKFPEHPRISEDLRGRYRISERKFNESADVVFASARGLWEEKRKYNVNTYFIPNGVSERFAEVSLVSVPEIDNYERPIVGFAGALSTATDNCLLAELAANMPDVSFVFLGTIDRTESLYGLDELENVHLQGLVAHEQLISWFQYFDVGLMPYKINSFQDYTFPSKMAEYLMAGLPIVSTLLPEVQYYRDVVTVVDNAKAMEAAIRKCLAVDSRRDEKLIQLRREVAQGLTWETQIEKIEAVIAEALS